MNVMREETWPSEQDLGPLPNIIGEDSSSDISSVECRLPYTFLITTAFLK